MSMRVQTYQRRQVVGDISMPSASFSTGKKTEMAAENANQAGLDTANRMVVEHDKARVRSTYNDFRESARQKYGELKSLEGFNATGKNSVSEKYTQWYDKEVSKFSDSLDNQDQQTGFKIYTDQRKNSDLDSLAVHEAAEHKKYLLSVHTGEVANAQADVMTFYSDDSKMADIEQGVNNSFDNTFTGLDTSAAKQKEIASIRALRIKMLAENGMTDKAKQLLEQDKDELKGAYFGLKDQVDALGLIQKSQSEADNIMSTVSGEKEQLSAARAIENPELRDATLARVKAHQTDIKRVADNKNKQENEQITNEAIDIYRNGGSKAQFLKLVDKTRDKATRKELIALAHAYYPDKKAGTTETDWNKSVQAYKEIDQSIKDQDPMSEAELIRKYRPHMTAGDFEETLKYLKNGGNVGGMSTPEADRWFKYHTNRKPEDRPEAFSAYWEYLKTQLEPGKKPTTDDYKRWSEEWMNTDGKTKDGGFLWFDADQTRAKAIKKNNLDDFQADEQTIPTGETATEELDGNIIKGRFINKPEKKDPLGIR